MSIRALALILIVLFVTPAGACGPNSDCLLPDGHSYRIRLPEQRTGRVGAILFLHGYLGHSADVMADDALRMAVTGLGLALIAPQSAEDSWASPGSPFAINGADDMDTVARVVQDAAARFPVDPARVMASGVSSGAMLVWSIACYHPGLFAGYVAFAGTLFDPQPARCAGRPAMLRHIHARADPVVPLEGGPAPPFPQFHLGSVPAAIAIVAQEGFGPAQAEHLGRLDCTVRRSPAGDELSLCLHDGGHDYLVPELEAAWRDLAARRGW